MNEDEVSALLRNQPIAPAIAPEQASPTPAEEYSQPPLNGGSGFAVVPSVGIHSDLPPPPTAVTPKSLLELTPEWLELEGCYDCFHQVRNQIIVQSLVTVKHMCTLREAAATDYNELRHHQQEQLKNKPAGRRRFGHLKHAVEEEEPEMLELKPLRVGMLGCGRIGRLIIRELIDTEFISPRSISISSRNWEELGEFAEKGVSVFFDNKRLAKECSIVLICCLPNQLQAVTSSIHPTNVDRQLEAEREAAAPSPPPSQGQGSGWHGTRSLGGPTMGGTTSMSLTQEPHSSDGADFPVASNAPAKPKATLATPTFFFSIVATSSLQQLRHLLRTPFVHRTAITTITPPDVREEGKEPPPTPTDFAEDLSSVARDCLCSMAQMGQVKGRIESESDRMVTNVATDLLSGHPQMYRKAVEDEATMRALRFLRT